MSSIIFLSRLFFWLSVATFALFTRELSAQAQTLNSNRIQSSLKPSVVSPTQTGTPSLIENSYLKQKAVNFTSAPIPGTTVTSASALVFYPTKPSFAATFGVAQAETTPNSIPSTNPNPGSNLTPAPPVPETPTNPAPVTPTPTVTNNFPDVAPNYWAYPFIQGLASKNVIVGFPDGTFKPEQPVNRAQFAAMLQKAFNNAHVVRQLSPSGFADVPTNDWATSAIKFAYETGFMIGYPNNLFKPMQEIPKVQAITGVANGLSLTPQGSPIEVVNTNYTDAGLIPIYTINQVAAATQNHLVVNYPDLRELNPQTPLTRAAAAALLYQTLVQVGQLQPLANNVTAANYIVGHPTIVSQTTPPTTPSNPVPATTPVNTSQNKKKNHNNWRFTLGPNIFVPLTIKGESRFGDGPRINLNKPTSAITNPDGTLVNNLNSARFSFNKDISDYTQFNLNQILAIPGRFEAWKGDLGLILDVDYYKVELTNAFDITPQRRGSIKLGFEHLKLDLALGYHFGTIPLGRVRDSSKAYFPSLSFEGFGGARYRFVHQDVDFNPGPSLRFGPDSLEPLVGARINLLLSKHFTLGVRGDVSFDVSGGGSQVTWNLLATLDWRISPGFYLNPGYRIYNTDLENGGPFGRRGFNLRAEGPFLGLTFHF